MIRKNQNKHLKNKIRPLKIIGEGDKGDIFGKIDGMVCFITDLKEKTISQNDVVDVLITNVTEKVMFAEIVDNEPEN